MESLLSRVELQVKGPLPRWAQQEKMQAGRTLFFLEVGDKHQ